MAYDHVMNQANTLTITFDNGRKYDLAMVEPTYQEKYGQVNTENVALGYKGENFTNVVGLGVDPSGFSVDIMSMKDQPFVLHNIQQDIEKTVGKCNIVVRFSPTSKQKSYELKFATISMQGAGNGGRANQATIDATGIVSNIVI